MKKLYIAKNIISQEIMLQKYIITFQALDQLGHHTDIWNKEVKDTWQTFFRVIIRIMKKGYNRQHPSAAIVFVGKGETALRPIVPKPLAVDQKNLITEVKLSLIYTVLIN